MQRSYQRPELIRALTQREPRLFLGIQMAPHPGMARLARSTGHDGVLIDLEHAALDLSAVTALAAVALAEGIEAWVRVGEQQVHQLGALLDAGISGVIAPRIETAEQAKAFASAVRFPPYGHRSAISALASSGWAKLPAADLQAEENHRVSLKILIESTAGVENVEEIATVEGVDMIGIGSNDLSSEWGKPGAHDEPGLRAAYSRVLRAATAAGKPAMIGGIGNEELFEQLLAEGFSPFVLTGTDVALLAQGARARVNAWLERRSSSAKAEAS